VQELQGLGDGDNFCNSIARDGSTFGGSAVNSSVGSYFKSPVYWDSSLTGHVIDWNYRGEIRGLDNHGTRSVGYVNTVPFSGAFLRDQQTGIMTAIKGGKAMDLGESGDVVVGYGSQPWVWTPIGGVQTVKSRLEAFGIYIYLGLLFGDCRACSDDGSVIVGLSTKEFGYFGDFGGDQYLIIELPPLVPYGSGTAGCRGSLTLAASPAPNVNTPSFSMTTKNAPASSLGICVVSDVADEAGSDAFFLGIQLHVGILSANELIALDGTTDPSGLGTAAAPIPNSPALAGKTFYAQSIWAWPLTACTLPSSNLSTSNGLAITILP
jgi:hypothetical protein